MKESDFIGYYQMDVIWAHLKSRRNPDGFLRFSKLTMIANLVIILPHSNAEEKRVISMIRKNKTAFRPRLNLDGTLHNMIIIKLANPEPCSKYEPGKCVLNSAKKINQNIQYSSPGNLIISHSTFFLLFLMQIFEY